MSIVCYINPIFAIASSSKREKSSSSGYFKIHIILCPGDNIGTILMHPRAPYMRTITRSS